MYLYHIIKNSTSVLCRYLVVWLEMYVAKYIYLDVKEVKLHFNLLDVQQREAVKTGTVRSACDVAWMSHDSRECLRLINNKDVPQMRGNYSPVAA